MQLEKTAGTDLLILAHAGLKIVIFLIEFYDKKIHNLA